MEVFLDLGIVIFIPFMIYRGYRRGAIKALCGFLAVFVAFFGATFLANNLYLPVGRLVQPVVRQVITQVLEETLGEDVLIEPPVVAEGVDDNPFLSGVVTEEEVEEDQYISLDRALGALQTTPQLAFIQGFLQQATDLVEQNKSTLVGSVTEMISTVVGYEIARQGIFVVAFIFLMAIWILFSRVLDKVADLPGLAQINGVIGGLLGFLTGGLLVFVFAWCTRGGVVPTAGVERTTLYELFATYSPLDMLARFSDVELDL